MFLCKHLIIHLQNYSLSAVALLSFKSRSPLNFQSTQAKAASTRFLREKLLLICFQTEMLSQADWAENSQLEGQKVVLNNIIRTSVAIRQHHTDITWRNSSLTHFGESQSSHNITKNLTFPLATLSYGFSALWDNANILVTAKNTFLSPEMTKRKRRTKLRPKLIFLNY